MAALNSKAKELQNLVGEYVQIYLKNISITETSQDQEVTVVSSSAAGYVIDVTNNYIYLAESVELEGNIIIDFDLIGIIMITDPDGIDVVFEQDSEENYH